MEEVQHLAKDYGIHSNGVQGKYAGGGDERWKLMKDRTPGFEYQNGGTDRGKCFSNSRPSL